MLNHSFTLTVAFAFMACSLTTTVSGGQQDGDRIPGQASRVAPTTFGGCPGETRAFHQCATEKAKTFTPPRTADGKPNLQGIWRHRLTTGFSVEGQSDPIDPESKASSGLIIDPADGRLPYQPWAVDVGRGGVHYRKFFDPHTSCRHNPPRDTKIAGSIYQILQPAGGSSVVWMTEESHGFRIISTDGRSHPGKDVKLWMGSSVGQWEGNTLVVDNANFNGNTWFDDAGNFYTDLGRVIERFTMIDADTIHYVATIEDPRVYTRPFTMVWVLARDKTPGLQILEDACREGDRDLPHFLKLGYRLYFGQTWRERAAMEQPR
jgi:hypothetical protein